MKKFKKWKNIHILSWHLNEDDHIQSNIVDSTNIFSEVDEESFVAEDCLRETHNETYMVSEKYPKGRNTTVVLINDESEEEEDEVRFDFSIGDENF